MEIMKFKILLVFFAFYILRNHMGGCNSQTGTHIDFYKIQ